jgi:hypothetical protein
LEEPFIDREVVSPTDSNRQEDVARNWNEEGDGAHARRGINDQMDTEVSMIGE